MQTKKLNKEIKIFAKDQSGKIFGQKSVCFFVRIKRNTCTCIYF